MTTRLAFKIRHRQAFSPEAFDFFCASCRLFEDRTRSILAVWDQLSATKGTQRPDLEFEVPVLSTDRRVAAIQVIVHNATTGSQALLLDIAKDLYLFLPLPVQLAVEVAFGEVVEEAGSNCVWRRPHDALGGSGALLLPNGRD